MVSHPVDFFVDKASDSLIRSKPYTSEIMRHYEFRDKARELSNSSVAFTLSALAAYFIVVNMAKKLD